MTDLDSENTNFLEQLPVPTQAYATAIFLLFGPRQGLRAPDAVVGAVRAELERRMAFARQDGQMDRRAVALHRALLRQPCAALDFARWIVARHRRTAGRLGVREQWDERRRWRHMARQPPTDRQVAYLRDLGWSEPVASMAEACDLIDVIAHPPLCEEPVAYDRHWRSL